ncbi:uncharacterized protein LOC129733214 [Wyeomyia smithii]|uniref:uncharacterized protein LOC129733214 n=1 Tax=Wyeomyia smithii TaxID=174621 RepID=UPI0024680D4B|nr:uncharacterized protein LOC129733214 [Wyeomyia smithii]XP_055550854.1 uncharacterized protein LOC129733214 [Wyeomyia smithii]
MDIRSLIKIWAVLFVLTVVSPAAVVYARRCYVCGEGAEAPFRTVLGADGMLHRRSPAASGSLPNIVTTCEDFEQDQDELNKYVLDCPPSYTSCLTQVDGDMELRTCGENLSINDCKSANKIDYCYCSEDLCNSLKRTQIRREIEDSQLGIQSQHLHQREPHNSDDEDLSESSGMGDSHEKHHRAGISVTSHNNVNNHHHQLDRDLATTQIVMTLKPIPTTERRNNNSHGRNDSVSAASGGASNLRWSPDRRIDNLLLLLLLAVVSRGLNQRFIWSWGHVEHVDLVGFWTLSNGGDF